MCVYPVRIIFRVLYHERFSPKMYKAAKGPKKSRRSMNRVFNNSTMITQFRTGAPNFPIFKETYFDLRKFPGKFVQMKIFRFKAAARDWL